MTLEEVKKLIKFHIINPYNNDAKELNERTLSLTINEKSSYHKCGKKELDIFNITSKIRGTKYERILNKILDEYYISKSN